MLNYESQSIEVEGGKLQFAQWQLGHDQSQTHAQRPVILASHGLTATHIGFQALADALAQQLPQGFRLIAPDHRGRGRSNQITGPWGMQAHAQDLLSLLDHLGLARVDVLLGHSMGGFVAAVLGAQAPQRVPRLMLVDGGLPAIAHMPQGLAIEELVQAIIGPSMDRLDMRFASREAYLDFWRAHPAFTQCWSAYAEQYADYDLEGQAPELRASTVKAAILRDVETQLLTDLVPSSLARLEQPICFLKAPRGLMNAEPLYADEVIEGWAHKLPGFSWQTLEDVNHFSILLSAAGAQAVARQLVRQLEAA